MIRSATNRNRIRPTRSETVFYAANGAFLTLFLIATVYPLLCLISSAISDPAAVYTGRVTFYPIGFSLRGFEINLQNAKVLIGFYNTLIYTVSGTALSLAVTLLTAFATACGACEPVCLGEAMKRFGRRVSLEEACAIALEDRMFYGDGGGVTLSGGEPLMQADFAAALLERLRKEGVHTAVDTCGNVDWAAFVKVLPHTDLFLYDVKHIDPRRHAALTGRSNEAILRNLRRLCETGKRVEIRMPLVPGANDDEDTLRGIGALLGSLPIERMRVLPYHSMARSKYAALGMEDTLPRVESPTEAEVGRAVALLREYGVPAISGRE